MRVKIIRSFMKIDWHQIIFLVILSLIVGIALNVFAPCINEMMEASRMEAYE